MKLVIIVILCLFMKAMSAQYIKSLGFELTYLDHQPALTEDHKELLVSYLDYLSGDEMIIFNIDTSLAKATVLEHQQRVAFLKTFLEQHGVPASLIHVIRKERDTLRTITEGYDILGCKIIYLTTDPNKRIVQDTSRKSTTNEFGVAAVGKSGSTTCTDNTSIPLKEGVSVTMNTCDYERFINDISFKRVQDVDHLFKSHTIPKENVAPLCAYDFQIPGDRTFMFVPVFKIPIESCMDKQDLSVVLCKNGTCSLIPIDNINDPEAKFIIIKTPTTGQIMLMYSNYLKTYKIKLEVAKTLHIQELTFNTRCHGMTFPVTIKKNKASVVVNESYYEPVISIKAVDKQGQIYTMTEKPFGNLPGGLEKIKDFRVYPFNSSSKEERSIPVFKKYQIQVSELNRVQK